MRSGSHVDQSHAAVESVAAEVHVVDDEHRRNVQGVEGLIESSPLASFGVGKAECESPKCWTEILNVTCHPLYPRRPLSRSDNLDANPVGPSR